MTLNKNRVLGIICILLAAFSFIRNRRIDSEIIRQSQIEVDNIVRNNFPNEEQLLEIPSISLLLPIKQGAIHENMIGSAATIREEKIEKGKNFSIAGHRSIRFGKNFNRLGEIKEGDIIKVREKGKYYSFQVNEVLVVEPHETEVLNDSGETEITLVTCHPIGISSHRLIIKGVLIDEK